MHNRLIIEQRHTKNELCRKKHAVRWSVSVGTDIMFPLKMPNGHRLCQDRRIKAIGCGIPTSLIPEDTHFEETLGKSRGGKGF